MQGNAHRIYAPSAHPCHHNPAVVAVDGRLLCNIRVSYERRTRNFLGVVENWELNAASPLRNIWARGPHGRLVQDPQAARHAEIEDLRLFMLHGALHAIAAVHEGGPMVPEVIRQGLVRIENSDMVDVHVFPSNRLEKNWMPLVDGDRLRFVYSCDPLRVVECHGEDVHPTASSIPSGSSHVRGSTALLPFEGGYIAIVHQVFEPPIVRSGPAFNPLMGFHAPIDPDPVSGVQPKVYLHQFVRFDSALSAVSLGPFFYFRHLGIEFCCGAAFWEGKLVAGVGVEEKEAWLVEIGMDELQRLLP